MSDVKFDAAAEKGKSLAREISVRPPLDGKLFDPPQEGMFVDIRTDEEQEAYDKYEEVVRNMAAEAYEKYGHMIERSGGQCDLSFLSDEEQESLDLYTAKFLEWMINDHRKDQKAA